MSFSSRMQCTQPVSAVKSNVGSEHASKKAKAQRKPGQFKQAHQNPSRLSALILPIAVLPMSILSTDTWNPNVWSRIQDTKSCQPHVYHSAVWPQCWGSFVMFLSSESLLGMNVCMLWWYEGKIWLQSSSWCSSANGEMSADIQGKNGKKRLGRLDSRMNRSVAMNSRRVIFIDLSVIMKFVQMLWHMSSSMKDKGWNFALTKTSRWSKIDKIHFKT